MDKDFTLDDLKKLCMDSAGYVVAAGILTNKKDKAGNTILDFHYRRYKFSFEDTKQIIQMFHEQLQKDVTEQFSPEHYDA